MPFYADVVISPTSLSITSGREVAMLSYDVNRSCLMKLVQCKYLYAARIIITSCEVNASCCTTLYNVVEFDLLFPAPIMITFQRSYSLCCKYVV